MLNLLIELLESEFEMLLKLFKKLAKGASECRNVPKPSIWYPKFGTMDCFDFCDSEFFVYSLLRKGRYNWFFGNRVIVSWGGWKTAWGRLGQSSLGLQKPISKLKSTSQNFFFLQHKLKYFALKIPLEFRIPTCYEPFWHSDHPN